MNLELERLRRLEDAVVALYLKFGDGCGRTDHRCLSDCAAAWLTHRFHEETA
jgi:hypothetical protein